MQYQINHLYINLRSKNNHLIFRTCQSDGTWDIPLHKIGCSLPKCPDIRDIYDVDIPDYQSGVTVSLDGFQVDNVANITCKSGYIVDTELTSVQVTCTNESVWQGRWGLNFTDLNPTETNVVKITDHLPRCFSSKPAFSSLKTCENGCQVGTCNVYNVTKTAKTFNCTCGDYHSGMLLKSKYGIE